MKEIKDAFKDSFGESIYESISKGIYVSPSGQTSEQIHVNSNAKDAWGLAFGFLEKGSCEDAVDIVQELIAAELCNR
jgi:hypothetical protein